MIFGFSFGEGVCVLGAEVCVLLFFCCVLTFAPAAAVMGSRWITGGSTSLLNSRFVLGGRFMFDNRMVRHYWMG